MTNALSRLSSEVYSSRAVLQQLVKQQLILRYRRTALGYLWTLINPLLMMSVMAVVFSTLFKADLKEFAIFLFAGMIPWGLFNSVSTQSSGAFINNEGLIKKIYIPKIIFPLSIAVAVSIDSLLSFVALFLIIIAVGGTVSWSLVFIPIAYIILFIFSVGFGLITSVLTVFFRDLQYVLIIAMQGLIFLTPVLYKHESLSGKVAWLVGLNPVAPFIEIFRAPLYRGEIPANGVIIQSVANSFVTISIGLLFLIKQEKKIVFRL